MAYDTRVILDIPKGGRGLGRISEKAVLFFGEVWMSLSPPLGSPGPCAHNTSIRAELSWLTYLYMGVNGQSCSWLPVVIWGLWWPQTSPTHTKS